MLDPAQETWSGLSRVCFARWTNLLTLDQTLIQGTIGYLSVATMLTIEDCLKTVLGLP